MEKLPVAIRLQRVAIVFPGGGDTVPGGDDTVPGGDTVPSGDDTVPGGDTVPSGDDTISGEDSIPGGNDTIQGKKLKYYKRKWIEGNPLIIHTGPKANQNLAIHINDMRPPAMGLVNIAVETREKALEAIDKLDAALEYALNENTRIGAYQVRLQETIENLTAEHENAIASESVIRDADMARVVLNYTKNNILSQAAQSMLSHANQNAGSVLSLLQ